MDFVVENIGDVRLVLLPGEVLDASNTKALRRDVSPILEDNEKVIFDMSQLQFVDSSGCGALMSFRRKLKSRGGDLKLCGVTEPVLGLFRLIRMNRMFDVFDSRQEAIEAFQK